MLNAFTVDVEDYFHAANLAVPPRDWETLPQRVVPNTLKLLELLAEHGVKATFFVLGWVAKRYPHLVREVDRAGHEIGSHSFWHRYVYELSPEEFRRDLRESRAVLEDLTGKPVTAFRAPTFSITDRSLWALDVLAEEGFTLDSSIFPIHHDRYGIPHAPAEPFDVLTASGRIREVPPGVCRLGSGRLGSGLNFPIGGGGYFRLLPVRLFVSLVRRVNEVEKRPVVFYLHPWELDPHQPCLATGVLNRWRQRQGLSSCLPKLRRLLRTFPFGPLTAITAPARTLVPDDLQGRLNGKPVLATAPFTVRVLG